MTSSNGSSVPPRFYAFSALAVALAVGLTWVVARSSPPPAPRPSPPPTAAPVVATAPPRDALANENPGARLTGDPPSSHPPPGAATDADAMAALVDATLPPPAADGGGLPLALPTRAELALLAPLTEGQRLGDAQVLVISRVEHGVVRVISRRGAETIDLAIALASAGDRPAAAKVGRYAIYHYNTSAPSLAASGLAVELATLLRRNVNVPPPPGMTEAPM